jgi:signal transduction histidine kinase
MPAGTTFICNNFSRWGWLIFAAACIFWNFGGHAEPQSVSPGPVETFTNILQVRRFASLQSAASCNVRLAGTVLWVSPERDEMILQDDSGGVAIRLNLHRQPEIQPGVRIIIEGSCLDSREGITFEMLVNDDGIHSGSEKSGTLFLSAGWHPISIEWFNGPGDFELEADYMGPGMSRQRIPDAALFRPATNATSGTNRLVHGLNYSAYEGVWDRLPDFSTLPVIRAGTATNFDLQFRPRDENVGLVFSGYFQALSSGAYQFWLKSDDGSKLYICDRPLRLTACGKGKFPVPRPISPGKLVPADQEFQWAEMEGIITHVDQDQGYGSTCMEVTADSGRAYFNVIHGNYAYLKMLLHSRVKAVGICQNVCDISGQTMPSLLVPGLNEIDVIELSPSQWSNFPVVPMGSLSESNVLKSSPTMFHIVGIVVSNSFENLPVIQDRTGRILLNTLQTIPSMGDQIEALGWLDKEGTNMVLQHSIYRNISENGAAIINGLPLLTRVIQVKSLSRTEAERGYPIKLKGVITANAGADFIMQDATASIYVQWNSSLSRELPQVGEFWEIEGESYVDFAPNVKIHNAVYLSPGILPEPFRPTRDELFNGSLDAQYIELEGFVTDAEASDLTLLTREGKVKLLLHALKPISLEQFKNTHVRIRGVSSPDRDISNRIASTLLLYGASVSLVSEAMTNSHDLPLEPVSSLLFFDVRADALRQVKIKGQILTERDGEYFLTDQTNGLRFDPESPLELEAGDTVEVVGFPDISGPSPVLHEALVRLTGHNNLPTAQRLGPSTLLNGRLDATLVSVKAHLIGASAEGVDQTLELQTGPRSYLARLAEKRGLLAGILPGSLLELTGTYAGHGGDRVAGQDIDSFELLLNSPADVQVLERPSWWTFRHTMAVIGGMMSIILAALVWITLLRRQVKEQTLRLTTEIKGREQTEYQRALEEERTRIASDLHDQLGATLTEIRFLGMTESRDLAVPPATRSTLVKVSEKSRQMVSSLDEIVWAINPANDSLPHLADYLCQVAEEFFSATDVRCRLDVDELLPSMPLTSEARHNLYLVVLEALNNIVKHSGATEAWLRIHWQYQTLHVIIEDNGCGFDKPLVVSGNGLSNMRRRLEKIGGHFEIDRLPAAGTVCRISLRFLQT